VRHLSAAARLLATAVVFLVALAVGVVVHLRTPAARRIVADRVNEVLTTPLDGKIVIERIGSIGWHGVTGVDARVEDPDGVTVVRARGTSASVDLPSLLRSLTGGATIVVDLADVTIADADVNLDADAAGKPRIARAFQPRESAPGGRPGPKVRVSLPRVHVTHATVHGQPRGAPPIDGEIDDTDASVLAAPPDVRVDVTHARIVTRSPLPAGKEARGDVEAHLTVPAKGGGPFDLRGTFRGTGASIEARADASYDGDVLAATVDVPAVAPERARALLPSWPLTAPLAVHVEGRGPLTKLDVRLHAALESGSVDVTGPVVLAPLGAQLRVEMHAVDPHGIVASVPPSDVSAAGSVTLASAPGGAITAHVALDVAGGRVGALRTPPIQLTGDIVRAAPPSADVSARASAAVHEPGAPMEVTARLGPSHGALVLSYSGQVRADRLENVPMLRAVRNDVHGQAAASVTGTFDLRSGRIDATVAATAEAVAVGPVSVAAVHAEAHVTGPVIEPTADLALVAEGLAAPAVHLATVQSHARFEITRGAFHDLDLRVDEAGEEIWLRAALIRVASGELRLDDAQIDGLGEPVQATVHASSASVSVHLAGPSIDLARVARFAHWPLVRGGHVHLDVDSTITHGATDGRMAIDLENGSIATLDDVSARLTATLHGRQITGRASARVADIGSLEVDSTSLELGGHALDPQSWRRAWGAVDTNVHVDLAKLVRAIPPGLVPLSEVRGVVDLQTRLERDSASDVTPEIKLSAHTTGLALFGHRASGATWSFQGIDPDVRVNVDGQTGETAVSAQVRDTAGDFATLTASSSVVPWSVLLLGDAPVVPALEAMPFDARVEILARRLENLPKSLLFGPTGALQASISWHGAAAQPTIDAAATLSDGVFDMRAFILPADLDWKGHYDGANATTSLRASVRGHPVLDAQATARIRVADVLAGLRGAELPWTASAAAQLNELPIQGFPSLDDRGVRGHATGEITVDKLHEDARADVAVALDGLKVGDIACRTASVDAKIDGHTMHATAAVDHTDGTLTLEANAGMHWGRALVPALDAAQPLSFAIVAKAFRAALLLPFVSRVFSDLDGRIDGEAGVTIDPEANVAHPRGTLTLREGAFEMNQLGGEFTGVSAKLTATPDGIVRLENVRANSLNGVLTAAATARLDGFALGGASATIEVPRTAPLPIVFDGVQIGTMDGRLDTTITPVPGHKGLHVALDVPTLHVAIPSAATHDVQTLGELQGVKTGIRQTDNTFTPIALDPPAEDEGVGTPRAPITIAAHLGKDVQVKREAGSAGQPDLAVSIEGDPVITLDDKVQASGQIRLVHGTIGVGGKPFEIEKGTVAFVGDDPTNPQVVLSAGWTAQDGTRVTADFVGPLKTGKVTLHANPAPPGGENAILALILFGSADQDANGGSASSATPAAGFAGSEATAPINKVVNGALEKFGLGGGVTTKVDTSQTNPRPEVELQIARDISLELAWVLMPVPGLPDTTLVTFSWRFLRKWSLLTTVGNSGTSILDVVWQHRY
jgi:translocation and assembly module TamB